MPKSHALRMSQAGMIADEVLKTKFDVTRIVFNKFKSAISFQPTLATVMSAEVADKKAEAGGMMDEYEIEEEDRAPLLADLCEFQLSAVRTRNCPTPHL